LRQDLKIHHLNLANTVKEVELLATTTKNNISRSVKRLNLRKRYLGTPGKLTPLIDAKIWKYEVKYQESDLETQIEKCDLIVATLKNI
jgi:hypothetical protein